MRESWDDATIKLGIKEKYFSYDATLFTKIDVEVELGKVLLTGVVPFGDMRLEASNLISPNGTTPVSKTLPNSTSTSILVKSVASYEKYFSFMPSLIVASSQLSRIVLSSDCCSTTVFAPVVTRVGQLLLQQVQKQ